MAQLTLSLDAYTKAARQEISAAQALADERKHAEVDPLHLVTHIIETSESAQRAFATADIDASDLLLECEVELRRIPRYSSREAFLSPRFHDMLNRAEAEAARERGILVDVQHLVVAAAQDTSGPVARVFRAMNLSAPVVRTLFRGVTNGSVGNGTTANAGPDLKTDRASRERSALAPAERGPANDSAPALDQYGQDLVRAALAGQLDPVIGRDAELRRVIQVLGRRRDNHPMLVGERGVGKSAIVHALAMRIAANDVPEFLRGKRLIALESGLLMAGTRLRSELEERVRNLLTALRDSGGNAILHLPDLSLVSSERGQSGVAELLASALSRGEIRAIVTATHDEVKKAQDGAAATLVRRFVTIPVEPPSEDEAIAALRALSQRLEDAHGVRISDPALGSAVRFAKRYVPLVQLPRSAVDLVDEAASRVRVQNDSVPSELDRIERRVHSLETQLAVLSEDLDPSSSATRDKFTAERERLVADAARMRETWSAELKIRDAHRTARLALETAKRDADAAEQRGDASGAASIRAGLPKLQADCEAAHAARKSGTRSVLHETVTPEDVAEVVAAWTGIPVAKMLEGETDKLLRMEEMLRHRVVGQEPALLAVAKAIRRGRIGLRDAKRPIGSFFFLGPTGVGKTELAKALAEFLFDDEAALTRLDMSEFMEKHSVARLLGSPPGYVDSEEGGFLTEAVRRRPYSVVLFDEVEKAHPDVFNILLQVLDDGRLTDSRGQLAYFADTVIILTSNVGSRAILENADREEEGGDPVAAQASLRDVVQRELTGHFRPEFLNRIDETVIFNRLTKETLGGVVDIQLKHLSRLVADRKIELALTPAARLRLIELGYDPAMGARPVRRVIVKQLQDPLAEVLLRGGYPPGTRLSIDMLEGAFTFTPTS